MIAVDTCEARKKVAIYARVSTEHEEQVYAMKNQKDWYSSILGIHPEWEVVQMYSDEGVTGTTAKKRPSFMRMINDARKGKFDMILTREVSRFARNTVDTLRYTRELKNHEVEVYFLNDGIRTFDSDGELRLSIMATLAQDESRKTSVRVKCGQQISMEKGVIYGNGNVLGYDRDGDQYVVNPEQAETVRCIFNWYAGGMGLKKIKWELERRGMRTAMGKDKWCFRSISRILRNPLYIGVLTYHREYTPDYLEQKKVVNHGEIPILQVQGGHEHIIPDELFYTVQERLEKKRKIWEGEIGKAGADEETDKDVWVKKIRCGCGSSFHRKRWHTRKDGSIEYAYCCYRQVRSGTLQERKNRGISTEEVCESSSVPDWKLQMMAVSVFRNCIQEVHEILGIVQEILMSHLDVKNVEKSGAEKLKEIKREIIGVKSKLDRSLDLFFEGDISKEEFRKKKEEYERRIAELREIEETLEADVSSEEKKGENLMERVRFLIDSLKSEMACVREDDHEIPVGIIDAFVERIVVKKNEFDWYLRGCRADERGSGERKNQKKTGDLFEDESGTAVHKEEQWDGSGFVKYKEIVFTKEEAKKSLYSIDNRRRIIKWEDIKVRIFV